MADLADWVREAVNRMKRQFPILTFTTSEADSCSDDEPRKPWRKG